VTQIGDENQFVLGAIRVQKESLEDLLIDSASLFQTENRPCCKILAGHDRVIDAFRVIFFQAQGVSHLDQQALLAIRQLTIAQRQLHSPSEDGDAVGLNPLHGAIPALHPLIGWRVGVVRMGAREPSDSLKNISLQSAPRGG